ncbi:hypothetical protein CEXT_623141 [Caerostris extrusa]|uniref:Uncharacterized protein n=1 Tax=Caerostris extrusa TaxID=172846 RepID=A0AAV4WK83_CAEEX|nr:hypothetical protein CEXT_623141 [Caerostris extrusa]
MACDITMCISVVEATYSRRKGSRREHLNSSLLLLSVVDVIRRITGYLLSSTLCHSRTSLSDRFVWSDCPRKLDSRSGRNDSNPKINGISPVYSLLNRCVVITTSGMSFFLFKDSLHFGEPWFFVR